MSDWEKKVQSQYMTADYLVKDAIVRWENTSAFLVASYYTHIAHVYTWLWEARLLQYRWISGKFPNALWPPPGGPPRPFFGKKYCDFFSKPDQTAPNLQRNFFRSEMTPPLFDVFSGKSWPKLAFLKQKKTQRNFLDRKWPPPLSEIFRKFIAFGKYRLP